MSDEKNRWDDFIKKNPKIKIDIQEKYLLNNREIVTSKYLQKLWGVTDKTIRNYSNDGMPVLKESSARFKLFDLIECISWRMSEIDMAKSNVSNTQQEESDKEIAESEIQKANRDLILANAKKAGHEANISEMKEKVQSGELISVDDVDKVSAEQAVLHKTDMINSEKILPTLLEGLDKGSIARILKDHNQQRLDGLHELIQKEFECEETFYEIIVEVLASLENKTPELIIKNIKG